jgi:hypothetical protein
MEMAEATTAITAPVVLLAKSFASASAMAKPIRSSIIC